MTPPRPTAPTAAELREAFRKRLAVHLGVGGEFREMERAVDALVAAVRAEALEEAATLAEIYVGLSARAARVPRAIRAMVSK